MNTFFSLYFLLGLIAVIAFFSSTALVGFSLFHSDLKVRTKVIAVQGVVLLLEFLFLLFLTKDLIQESYLLFLEPEPSLLQIGALSRNFVSYLLFGLALIFGLLISAFSWIKLSRLIEPLFCLLAVLHVLQALKFAFNIVDIFSEVSNGSISIEGFTSFGLETLDASANYFSSITTVSLVVLPVLFIVIIVRAKNHAKKTRVG